MSKQKTIDPKVGERVRELRKAREMRLKEVAVACGISQQLLSYYERGEVAIPSRLLAPLARQLHCRVTDLVRPPPKVDACSNRPKLNLEVLRAISTLHDFGHVTDIVVTRRG